MTAKRYFLPLVLAGALLAGCDDKKVDQPKVDNTPKMPNVNDIKAGVDKAADQAKTAAADASKATADAAKTAADSAKTATTDAAAAVQTQASDWMAKLEDAIKSNKLDEGQTYVDKLDSVKASLPAEWQTKLDSLKATFNAAKAKAAIPGLNK
jgi:hypothetical protein